MRNGLILGADVIQKVQDFIKRNNELKERKIRLQELLKIRQEEYEKLILKAKKEYGVDSINQLKEKVESTAKELLKLISFDADGEEDDLDGI